MQICVLAEDFPTFFFLSTLNSVFASIPGMSSPALFSPCSVFVSLIYSGTFLVRIIKGRHKQQLIGKWTNSRATVTIIVGGDGCDLIVPPPETISRVGFARSPEAIATIKLHVEQDCCPHKYSPFVLKARKSNVGMKQWNSAQKLL